MESVLAPEVAAIIHKGGIAKNKAAFLRLLEQEDGEGYVYSFPLLQPEFCARLVQEKAAFLEFSRGAPRPGRSESSALKHFGCRWLDEQLLEHLLVPMSELIFPTMLEATSLDWCHGYIASYQAAASEEEQAVAEPAVRRFGDKLNAHTDDSEVTLNVGLVDTFTGGELHFRHIRGTDWEGKTEPFSYMPQVGIGLIHMGRHLHEVVRLS